MKQLMSLHTIDDLTSCILDFQANFVRIAYRKKATVVDPDEAPEHESALESIWIDSKLEEEVDSDGQVLKWRKLGFESEDIIHEFEDVGLLGLECLVREDLCKEKFQIKMVSRQQRLVHTEPDFSRVRSSAADRNISLMLI
jgi:hypothetical protein